MELIRGAMQIGRHERGPDTDGYSEKIEELKAWLSTTMGAEVDSGREFRTDTFWFRILVRDVQPPPMLWVSLEAFEDHAVEKIWNDLERQQVPGMLVTDPSQHLLYTTSGEVGKYDDPT